MSARTNADVAETPTLDCEQTVRQLWDYLDGEVGAGELAAIDAHLASCDPCRGHFAFERTFLAAVRSARDAVSASESMNPRGALRARVIEHLALAGALRSPQEWL
jgi:predicted anti-sigma-YlaC factor YlaD